MYCHGTVLASNLVYIRVLARVCQDVKTCVNIVEQVDYLDGSLRWGVLAAEGIESHNATEEDGHVVVAFCRDGPFVSQLVGDRWRQNGIEQSKRKKRNEQFERKRGYGVLEQQSNGLGLPDWRPSFGSAVYLLTHHLLVISLCKLLSDGRVVFLW